MPLPAVAAQEHSVEKGSRLVVGETRERQEGKVGKEEVEKSSRIMSVVYRSKVEDRA